VQNWTVKSSSARLVGMKSNRRLPNPKIMTPRGAATRARIVEAAADLVHARGVSGTSLDQIMEAGNVSKSQLYHYFADKDALMLAVIEFQTSRVVGFQATYLDRVVSLAGLRDWRDAAVAMTRATNGWGGCPIGSLASELSDRSESARTLLARGFERWVAKLSEGLQTMRARGEIRSDADCDELATAVIAALQGGILLAQASRATRPLELALDMAIAHIARAAA
jgi:TetR/AcrR family transcriptional repressor of nem operon